MGGYVKAICRTRDELADADLAAVGAALLRHADALEAFADNESDRPDSDRLAALVVHLIADVHFAATGQLSRRLMADTELEPTLGPVLDRMAAEPGLRERAALVAELWDRLVEMDEVAAEEIAGLPYGGLVGGRDEMFWPSSLPKLMRNLVREHRRNRAVA